MTEAAEKTVKKAGKHYRWPSTVVSRFIARRTYRSAGLWALIFGIYTADKILAFAKIAPTAAARAKVVGPFSNNVGLNALLGTPHHLNTFAGYANWNTLGVLTIIASIWAFLLATKYIRGEEDNGRTEIMLAGQTTPRRNAVNQLLGLGSSFVVMFALTALLFIVIGKNHTLNFSQSSSFNFALASVSGATLFLAIGSLASQIMPTRSRASSLCAIVFGVFFLIRVTADVTSLHWLLYITPLGWIEKLQPLVGSQIIWYLPIYVSTLAMAAISIYLAGKRDFGDGLVADKDTAKPHTKLLSTPFGAALRLSRSSIIGWLSGLVFASLAYGFLTKAAVQAFNQASSFHKLKKGLSIIVGVSHVSLGLLFLSIIFLLLTALVMAFGASSVSKIREDEAQGYVDNFLVRSISRWRWLCGRLVLVIFVASAACIIAALVVWLGQSLQHNGSPFSALVQAGANMIPAVIFTVASGILIFGILPRLTSVAVYAVLGWSFLLYFVGSGLSLNHWLMDTSIFHQLSLAPANHPNWTTDLIVLVVSLVMILVGGLVFNRRDLAVE